MKNKYNSTSYKECAEVKVYHKSERYSFLDETEQRNIKGAVEYVDSVNGKDYHIFLKDYDENSLQLVYEYNNILNRAQLNEILKKDLTVISNYLYAVSPAARNGLRSGRTFMFVKEKTVMTL